ncbi:transposase, partial [Acinetobacter baumannii]
RNGLRYFHQLPYIDALKIKTEMITEIEDGFTVVLNGQYYWLPKTQ